MMTMHWSFPNRAGFHQGMNSVKPYTGIPPMYNIPHAHHLLSNNPIFGARHFLQTGALFKDLSPPLAGPKQETSTMLSPPKLMNDIMQSACNNSVKWTEGCYQEQEYKKPFTITPKRKYKKRVKETNEEETKLLSPNSACDDSQSSTFEMKKESEGDSLAQKRMYQCHDCQYMTDRKNNLKRHVATMHECCTKVLECCDTVFANKALLREHVRSCHSHGYDCKVCGRTFCRKALLKRHITVHSGQKDFVCGLCGYATSHKSNLDRHKRRHLPKHLRKPLFYSDINNTFQFQQPDAMLYDATKPINHIAQPPVSLQIQNPYFGQLRSLRFNNSQFKSLRSPKRLTKLPSNRLLKKKITNSYKKLMMLKFASKEHLFSKALTETRGDSKEIEEIEANLPQRLNKFRLAPKLHKCRVCDTVFSGQLELHKHQDEAHDKETNDAPQRPLTVEMRQQTKVSISSTTWRY